MEIPGRLAKEIQIPLPPLPIQRRIAAVLSCLDDKIEINNRVNSNLEAQAQAIFKNWFVDFEPFKDGEFVESELGLIPKGWKVGTIGEMVQVLGGGTPSTKEPIYWEDGIHPFCTPKDMATVTNSTIIETERKITDQGLAQISSGQLPIGTVLLSSRAPIGYLAITEIPISINQGIIAMICHSQLPNYYVLHWTKHNMEHIISKANGSTFLEINKQNFRPIKIIVPPVKILDRFTEIIDPVYRQIVSFLFESRNLTSIRDTLLPRLMSGEIEV
jgi:type I restriction enzyme S subunit